MAAWRSPRLRMGCIVGRAWGLHIVAVALVVQVVLCWNLPHAIGIPGRGQVSELVWPIAPALPAIVAAVLLGRHWDPRSLTARRSRSGMRSWFLVAVALLDGPALAVTSVRYPTVILVRNSALIGGLGMWSATLLPEAIAWIPPVALPLLCWFLGPRPAGARPAGWALVLQPAGDRRARTVAVLVFASAAVAFISGLRPRWTRP